MDHVYHQLLQVGGLHLGPASDVEDGLDVITVEEEVTDCLHGEQVSLSYFYMFQILQSVVNQDLIKAMIRDVAHGADDQDLQVEAEGEEADQEVLGAGAGD